MLDVGLMFSRIIQFLKLADEILGRFMKYVLFLVAVGGAGSGVLAILRPNIGYIALAVFFTLTLGVAIILLLTATNKIRKKYQVRILRKYVTYRYYPDGQTMDHTKRYEIIALVDGVKEFIDRYKWACKRQQRCKVTLLNQNNQQQLQEEIVQEWFLNRVIFNPALDRGKKAECTDPLELDRGLNEVCYVQEGNDRCEQDGSSQASSRAG